MKIERLNNDTPLTRHVRDKQRRKSIAGRSWSSRSPIKAASNRIRAYHDRVARGIGMGVSILIRTKRHQSDQSIPASLETQSVKSQPDRLTQFTGHRSHRDMYTRQSECALT